MSCFHLIDKINQVVVIMLIYKFRCCSINLAATPITNTTTYTYDLLGQLIRESNAGWEKQYTYDSRGTRTKMVADGVKKDYTYDKNNLGSPMKYS